MTINNSNKGEYPSGPISDTYLYDIGRDGSPIDLGGQVWDEDDSLKTDQNEIIPLDVNSDSVQDVDENFESRRRFVKRIGKYALNVGKIVGGAVIIKTAYNAGYNDHDRDIIKPRFHTVSKEEAALERSAALIAIFNATYHPNFLVTEDGQPDEEAVITYMENGGIINHTAIEQERQTDELEAGDELELPDPPNSNG